MDTQHSGNIIQVREEGQGTNPASIICETTFLIGFYPIPVIYSWRTL